MKKLLSLPPNLVECFHDITGHSRDEWFCTNDPIGHKLGSGGGTAWTVGEARRTGFLAEGERCIIVHAGGQSRRLPAYAPSGKVLTPVPVFRWQRGQRLGQTLLDLQLPLYERIMAMAPASLTTMIVSGDVLIRAQQPLQPIPEADVVCYGLWADPHLATHHGVFVASRQSPDTLDFMLQKPTLQELAALMPTHLVLMDIGIWMLSDRALRLLMKRCHWEHPEATPADGAEPARPTTYDLYAEFGLTLGRHPRIDDPELSALSVAILPLPGGEFHHYGTSPEVITSTAAIQNSVIDQRAIIKQGIKPHPTLFIQNAIKHADFPPGTQMMWIENSVVGPRWRLASRQIITGVPDNDWALSVPEGTSVDVVPIGAHQYAARPYGWDEPHPDWLLARCAPSHDAAEARRAWPSPQTDARIYPIVDTVDDLGRVIDYMVNGAEEGRALYEASPKMSADELSAYANLRRLEAQRRDLRRQIWPELARNHRKSVFYQLDLGDAAREFKALGLPLPAPLAPTENRIKLMSDAMFRAVLTGDQRYDDQAFAIMREGLTETAMAPQQPRLSVYADQIVWSRSPVRIDIAGGWTDTPPYSLMQGGSVVGIAIELNGQPPLQVYVKPSAERSITLRSIDLGAAECITTYAELEQCNQVGSPFSIPKAALMLAGFVPRFSQEQYPTLEAQLEAFGSGLEMTMLSAIPAGSGLGTSSILASTVLGAIGEFCGLGWDRYEICNRTLVLEQLLTTGGGWQDQYGGVLHGVKLLQTQPGWEQQPVVRWLPDTLFTAPEYQPLHLLYYTGVTRTAKGILAEIVRGMFLGSSRHLQLLGEMKQHAMDLYDAIQRGGFDQMGRLVGKTWQQNQAIDAGTNPPAIQALTSQIDDLCLGYKLPGAGGGGYLYMVAKDEEAARRIRQTLTLHPANAKARFVEMSLSRKGLEISKS